VSSTNLSYSHKTFIMECDASWNGIGVFLMQERRPIYFVIHPIKGNYLHIAIYYKEILAILHELKKWWPYIIGQHFKVNNSMIVLNDCTNIIFIGGEKMGHKDVGLWIWNHRQKSEEKCCCKCTLKKGWGCRRISLFDLYYATWLDNWSKDEWKNHKEVRTLMQNV